MRPKLTNKGVPFWIYLLIEYEIFAANCNEQEPELNKLSKERNPKGVEAGEERIKVKLEKGDIKQA